MTRRSQSAAEAQGARMPFQPNARASKRVENPLSVSLDPSNALRGCQVPLSTQTLTLDGFPSRQQQDTLGPNNGSKRWAVASMRDWVQTWVMALVLIQRIKPVPPPVHAVYRFVVPDKTRRDWDNYALICKPVQDGLVKAGVLVGDYYAVLDANVQFSVEKGSRRLEVILERATQEDGGG